MKGELKRTKKHFCRFILPLTRVGKIPDYGLGFGFGLRDYNPISLSLVAHCKTPWGANLAIFQEKKIQSAQSLYSEILKLLQVKHEAQI